jgi:putative endonuclease
MLTAFVFLGMFYYYIIYSKRLDKYYVGSTNNVEGRLRRHNSSNQGYTSKGKPWELKYYEVFEDRTSAIKREFQLKSYKDRRILEKLIESGSGSSVQDKFQTKD